MAEESRGKAGRGEPVRDKAPLFGEEQCRQIEQMYQSKDRAAMRADVFRALELREGERVLELGAGPGVLAHALGVAVGPTGRVVGLDVNEGFVEMSRLRCAELPWVEFRQGRLEDGLPLPDGEFDAVTASAVLQYVAVKEMPGLLAEIQRVLRPGGRVVIHDTEWDSMVRYSRNRARMKRVLAAWRSVFANPHLFQTLAPQLRSAGLVLKKSEVLPTFHLDAGQNTLMPAGEQFLVDMVTDRLGVTREEAEAWAEEQRQLGEEDAYFHCVLRFLFLATKPGEEA